MSNFGRRTETGEAWAGQPDEAQRAGHGQSRIGLSGQEIGRKDGLPGVP